MKICEGKIVKTIPLQREEKSMKTNEKWNDKQEHMLYEKPTLAVIRFTEKDISTESGWEGEQEEGELILG